MVITVRGRRRLLRGALSAPLAKDGGEEAVGVRDVRLKGREILE